MRSPLPFLMATLALDAMGIGMVYPVMPDLLEEVGRADVADAALWGGALATTYAVMQFLFAPVLGALSDRWGRRPVLLGSLAVMAVDHAVTALAGSMGVLLLLRVVAGVTAATHATCNAALADATLPEGRARGFGLLGAAFMGGFILGPVIGGALGEWGPRAPFWAAAALAAANLAFGWWSFPETLAGAARRRFDWGRASPLGAFRSVGRLRGVAPLLVVLFLSDLAYISYVATWAFWGKAAFGWTPWLTGVSLAAFGAGAVVAQGWGTGLYLRRFGERGAILWSIVFTLVFLVVYAALPPNPWGSLLAILLCPVSALGEVLLPVLQGRISRLSPEDAQGEALGVVASTRSAAQIAGPMLMTGTFAWGASVPGGPLYGAPYLLGALLMAVALLVFQRSVAPEPLAPRGTAG